MGIVAKRPKTKIEKQLAEARKQLLDTQELTADLFEQNQKLNNSLLDTQDLITQFVEKGGVI